MNYTMKNACEKTGMTYETLRFYCDIGLVPNIKRNKNNYRIFNEKNILWIESLKCLRKCGMSIKDMKKYMNYCMKGESSINERKDMLKTHKEILLTQLKEIEESLEYINKKQKYFFDVQGGSIKYTSNIFNVE